MESPHHCFKEFFGTALYLSFLRFDSADLSKAMKYLRLVCEERNATSDLIWFLTESGWREHLTACVAALSSRQVASQLAVYFWRAFDKHSWVSPQLAVTLWLIERDFESNAKGRIKNVGSSDFDAKGISALVYLLDRSEKNAEWLAEQMARDEMKMLFDSDMDDGGEIAENWLRNIKAHASELQLELE